MSISHSLIGQSTLPPPLLIYPSTSKRNTNTNTNANRNVISWKHNYKYMINHNWSLGSQLLGQYDLDPILTGTLTENLRGKRTNKILYLMCVTVSWHMNIIECMLKTKFALFWGLKANWWMIETLFWKLLFRGNHQCAMNDKIFNFVGNKPLPNAFTVSSFLQQLILSQVDPI